jgi:DNA helicase-2/ATP-dependent DNA helicase PcrA
VITHRIAHGVDTGAYSPSRVMAVTFTAKAAEMRGRLRALGVEGVAARFSRDRAGATELLLAAARPRYGAVDHRQQGACARAGRRQPRPPSGRHHPARRRQPHRVAEGRDANDRSGCRCAPEGLGNTLDAQVLADLRRRYEKVKDERRQLDFEDVLLRAPGCWNRSRGSQPRCMSSIAI